MKSKLQLSKETLRDLTSELPMEGLADVRGGGDASLNTCLECVTTLVAGTYIDTGCWHTLANAAE